jgi:catechol 2,3-dioxygenase-like lactoylglutathione lyase family enzyme
MPSSLGYDGGIAIGLPVRDLDAAIAWYAATLDFALVFKMDDMGWAEVATETTGVTLGLSQVEEVKTGGATRDGHPGHLLRPRRQHPDALPRSVGRELATQRLDQTLNLSP